MASSLAANGYQKFHSGLVIQWGVVAVGDLPTGTYAWTSDIVFPIAFGALANVQVSKYGEASSMVPGVRSTSLTGFTAFAEEWGNIAQSANGIYWFAIGWV
jgi:hypothetical protein